MAVSGIYRADNLEPFASEGQLELNLKMDEATSQKLE